MVSKTSAGATKKTPASAKAKKSALKTTAKTTAVKKTSKTKTIDRQVPVKEDVNPLEKVMEIKAHNEEKKISKSAPKEAKAKSCCCCTKDGIFSTWARAYKNIFNYKGRASRYDFWGFSLMNLFFMLFVIGGLFTLFASAENIMLVTTVGTYTLLAFLAFEFLVYLSLSVRRLHDAGYTAWKGFFGPFIWSTIICFLFSFGSDLIVQQMGPELLNAGGMTETWLSLFTLGFVVALLVFLYYSAKIFVVTSFYEEDKDNEYGEACFATACCKAKALRYTILHWLILVCLHFITAQINSYPYISQF